MELYNYYIICNHGAGKMNAGAGVALTVTSSNTVYGVTVCRRLFSIPLVPPCARDSKPCRLVGSRWPICRLRPLVARSV